MTDEQHRKSKGHIASNFNSKKKESIRIFVQRKHLSHGILHKPIPTKSHTIEHLTATIEKHLNVNKKKSRNNKHLIVVNYKPVFVHSRQQKSTESKTVRTCPSTNEKFSSTNHNNRRSSVTTIPIHSTTNHTLNREPLSFDVPDVEDPLMFIEMMYQQLFTEDGQLRSGAEPTVLANCVKEIITNSRRNSMTRRDSLTSNFHQEKRLLTPFTHSMSSKRTSISSPCFFTNTFNKEEEEFSTLLQSSRTSDISRRSSKRSSIDNTDPRLQQLYALFNSCYHHPKQTSQNQITTNPNYPFSIDDTDNEDFDTFSDFNSCRKTIRTSLPESLDEDTTHTDSKLLFSSGYQSLQSSQPIKYKTHSENDQYYCPNCIYIPEIIITPPTTSLNIIQPIRDVFIKFLNFVCISKNIFLLPLCVFLLRQRSMSISY
ncbi:unnamed protein product [Rotaria sp. Silwood2]|nr:unnamed protein product [Rotaria sp. Silwood2]CAF2566572.1 unnamed protein product [Rotaria sp. Silwood2]CAF2916393.1 unnamed protein product [Rotaria sp. Silwood2]CAF3856080.1 unnamed protein product [Rotaria sp. Silwood2]CAF3941293.1 unnamed protein product [Rotaria sp. Silwood2]